MELERGSMTHGTTNITGTRSARRKPDEPPHVALSQPEHDALHSALATMLSPLDSVDAEAWRGEVGAAVCKLVGADRAAFQLDAPDVPLLYSEYYPQATLDSYVDHYRELDIGRQRRDALGLEVWNRALLHGPQLRTFWESEIHRDFLVPNRILDSMGLTVTMSGASSPATLFCHNERPGRPEFGEKGLALLSLLLPAFKAGVRDLIRYSRQRDSLGHHLDSLSEGIRISDLTGKTVHQNPAFTATLAADGAREKLEAAIAEILHPLVAFSRERGGSASALAGRRVSLEVHTHRASYEVRGSFLGRELLGADPRITISLQRLPPNTALSDRALQERFGLTAREVEITRRLEQGQSTKEVAQSCGISLHTARHHSERIFAKLGVKNRSQIGPRLHGG